MSKNNTDNSAEELLPDWARRGARVRWKQTGGAHGEGAILFLADAIVQLQTDDGQVYSVPLSDVEPTDRV